MPLPYPLPPPPLQRPGVPSGPYDVPGNPEENPESWHPQHRPVPLVLGESAMYPGMLSWRPAVNTTSRKAGLVLPVVG